MIKVTCGGCGKAFGTPDQFAGRQAKCPACGAALVIPSAPAVPDVPPAATPARVPPVVTRPPAVAPPRPPAGWAPQSTYPQSPAYPPPRQPPIAAPPNPYAPPSASPPPSAAYPPPPAAGPPSPPPSFVTAPPKPLSVLAIIGLILSVPFLCLGPLSLVPLGLSVLAIFQTHPGGKRRGQPLAITGAAIAALGLVLSIFTVPGWIGGISAARTSAHLVMDTARLAKVQMAMQQYAGAHQTKWPGHVDELLSGNYGLTSSDFGSATLSRQPGDDASPQYTYGDFTFYYHQLGDHPNDPSGIVAAGPVHAIVDKAQRVVLLNNGAPPTMMPEEEFNRRIDAQRRDMQARARRNPIVPGTPGTPGVNPVASGDPHTPGVGPGVGPDASGDPANPVIPPVRVLPPRPDFTDPRVVRGPRGGIAGVGSAADALAALKGGPGDKYDAGLMYLSMGRPADPQLQPEIAALLGAALKDDKSRSLALRALQVWATRDQVPALIEVIEVRDATPAGRARSSFATRDAITILGTLGDARAAAPLAKYLTGAPELRMMRMSVSAALVKIGPEAEPAVIPALEDPDVSVRRTACDILGKIGTAAGKVALQKAAQKADNASLQRNIDAALKAIDARAGG